MKLTIHTLALLVFFALPQTLPAQQPGSGAGATGEGLPVSDIEAFINDGAQVFTAPVHWQGRDWLALGAVAGATVVAFTLDESVRSAALPHKPMGVPLWSKAGDLFGRPEAALAISGGLYFGGLIGGSDATRTTGRLVLESVAYSGIITTLLKSLVGRSRPYMNHQNASFHWFESDNDNLAFPSGHTTVAFAISSVLAARADNLYASIGLYGLALLTAVQRMITDNHWLSDTVLGASIGTAVGLAVVTLEEERRISTSTNDVPYVGGYTPHAPLFSISVGM